MQALLRREIPDGDPGAIFDRALRLLLDKVEKTKLAAAEKPRPGGAVRSRTDRRVRNGTRWGLYGHESTREGASMRVTNRRFNDYLRAKGYEPAGGEAKDGFGWASWRNRTDLLFSALLAPR